MPIVHAADTYKTKRSCLVLLPIQFSLEMGGNVFFESHTLPSPTVHSHSYSQAQPGYISIPFSGGSRICKREAKVERRRRKYRGAEGAEGGGMSTSYSAF